MPEEKTLPSAREHAATTIASLIANSPDKGAAAEALAVPAFSSGTRAIDPATQQPIEAPPPFAEGQVALPEGDGTPVKTPQDLIAEHQARVAAASPGPDQPSTETPPAPQPAGAEAGAAAVEAAIDDIWADVEDYEFEDPELGVKIPMRFPKKFAERAKRGYGKQAALDREIRYLGEARGALEPLIADGRIQRILPLIQRALADKEYGDHVWATYQRSVQGLPLVEQARLEAAAAGTVAATPPAGPVLEGELLDIDPLFAPTLQPVLQKFATLEQRLQAAEAQRTQEQQRAAEAQRVQQANNEQLRLGHQDLARMMPNDYTGNLATDQARWNRTFQFAKENGYFDAYGLRAGVLFAGQYLAQLEADRVALTRTDSPAATALQQIEARQIDAATREAAAAARTVSGGGAVSPPPPAVSSAPIPTLDPKTGKPRPAADYLRDVQQRLAAAG